jgi:hypothetical protein
MKNTFFVILLIAFIQVAFIAAAEDGAFLNDVPAKSSSVTPVTATKPSGQAPKIFGGKVHKVNKVHSAPKGHEYLDHFYDISVVNKAKKVVKNGNNGKKVEKTAEQKAKNAERSRKDKLFRKADAKARNYLNKSSKALRKLVKNYRKSLKHLKKAEVAKKTTEIEKLKKTIDSQKTKLIKAIDAMIKHLTKRVTYYKKEKRTHHLKSTNSHIAHLQRLKKVVNGNKWTKKEKTAELKYRIEKTKIRMEKKKSQLKRLSKQLKTLQMRLAKVESKVVNQATATKPAVTQTTFIPQVVTSSSQTKPAATQ